ncbi:MAG TPA: HEAT repeat domain-containing protein [Roseiflexaceae bacterium]|nr:HEAT repeat domain-containing protein [Roseiflexaceae bacterium]
MIHENTDSAAQLLARIAELEQALERLADLPAAQAPLAAQLAEARQRLAQLQTGGANPGGGNSIGAIGDVLGGDKVQSEQVSQTVYQIVLAQRDPAELRAALDQLLANVGTAPGREFDLYQAVAAGLGRANVSVTVDAGGAPQLVDDAGLSQPLFAALLERLRRAIMAPDGALSVEERQVRAMRYRALIIEQFRDLRLEGLSTGTRPIILPLKDVYVQLRAVAALPERADAFTPEERRLLKLLDEERVDGRADEAALREAALRLDALRRGRWTHDRLERFPIAEALVDPQQRGLVILGDPGSGKSTLLHFLAFSFAEGPEVAAARLQVGGADADRLPIFAPLAAYDDMLNQTPELTIHAFLPRYYDQRRAAPGLGPVFDHALAEGRALVLLDGLDEVIDERRRRFVAEQATRFVQDALPRGNRVVVTSRVYGYRAAPLAVDLPHITVLDFRKEEIAAFARQWFRAFQRWKADGELSTQAELLAQQEERQLLDEIGRNPGVERLAVNPLLLTMLALLRQQIGTLPQRRITLYDEHVRALILRWEEHRSRGARLGGGAAQIDLQEAEGALIQLALWLQNHRPSGTATHNELLELLTLFYLWEDQGLRPNTDRILPPQRRQAVQRAGQFLHDMRHSSGLLIELGQGVFGFRHLTFQEYFAGRALARMLADERWIVLKDNLHSARWHEPLLLCAARLGVTENRVAEAGALVTHVMDAASDYEALLHRDLFLAADCAADDIGLPIPLLQRITDRLAVLLDARVPSVARGALQRLHGLALLRAGVRARLPAVQRRVIVALLHEARVEQRERLARFPVQSDPEVRAILTEHLSDRSWEARLLAIQTLAPCFASDSAVREAILACAGDLSENVRRQVVSVCAPLLAQDADLRQRVWGALTDPASHVREVAIYALEPLLLQHAELAVAVRECLYDDADDVRFAAVMALVPLLKVGDDLLDMVVKALTSLLHSSHHEVPFADRLALPEGGVPLIEPLLAYLQDADDAIRLVAVDLLGPFVPSHPEVRDALIAHLQDPISEVRELVIEVLAEVAEHDQDAVAALYGLVESDDLDTTVLDHLLWGMQPFLERDGGLRAHLIALLGRSDPFVRGTVLRALAPLAASLPDVREVQRRHLSDSDRYIRSTTLDALKPLLASDPEVRRAVAERAIDPEPHVRQEVLIALAPHAANDPHIAGVMRRALQERDATLRRRLVDLLAPLVQTQDLDAGLLAEQFANQTCAEATLARAAAVQALGLLADDPQVCDVLRGRLADEDARVRRAAIQVLATQCGQCDAICQAVQLCLTDPDVGVATAAAVALAPYAGDRADVRAALLAALGGAARPLRDTLLAALGPLCATVDEVRDALVALLAAADTADDGQFAAQVLKVLTPLVPLSNDVRGAVLTYLRQTTWIDWESLVALEPLMPHDSELCLAVLHCLRNVTSYPLNIRVLRPLVAADADVRAIVAGWLKHRGALFRQTVVGVLAELLPACPDLREPVMALLGDPEPEVRAAAVTALAPLLPSDPAVARALVAALDDSFVVVWEAVCEALAPLVASHSEVRALLLPGLTYQPSEMQRAAIKALAPLARQDSEVLVALLQRLADPNSGVRHLLIDVLVPLAADLPDVRAALIPVLADLDEYVRIKAMAALAPLANADPALRRALVQRLDDTSDRVRGEAVAVLARLAQGDPALHEALLARRNDASLHVRRCLMRQLVRLEGTGATSLLTSIADSDEELRTAALEELIISVPPDPAAVAALLPMVEPLRQDRQDALHRQRLAEAPLARLIQHLGYLIRDDERLRAATVAMLDSPDWRQRGGAAHVLAEAGPAFVRAALPQLLAALDDWRGHESWQVRLAAAAALINHDRISDQAIALLQEALAVDAQEAPLRGNGGVRSQAARALGRLRALQHRRDVAAQIVGLLATERDGAVLDSLYHALAALAAAPEEAPLG